MRLWLIAVILAASASFARADTPRAAMEDYLSGEISGGWVLTGMGVGGIVTGAVLIAGDGDRAQGASYVTFGFGAAHLIAGVYVNVASRVRRRVYRVAIDKAPQVWVEAESQRMKGVSTQFLVLKIVEVVLIAGGGTMAYLGSDRDRPQLEGAGYALAAEAAATLLFDIVASRRASRYRTKLASSSMLTRDAAGQPVLLGGLTLQF